MPEINRIKLPDFGIETINMSDAVNKSKIEFSQEIVKPPVCIGVRDGQEVIPFGTYGNFSAIVGAQKSRKTFLCSMPMAAAIRSGNYENFVAYTSGKVNIWFDTEQSSYYAHRVNNRTIFMAEKYGSQPYNFRMFCLRSFNYMERYEIIKHILRTTKNIGYVIIDGIRDLVRSINDEGEASEVVSFLLRATHDYDCHISVILHLRKGDSPSPRGFIGTEIQNKAESIIEVEKSKKNKDFSEVRARDFRGIEFNDFYMKIEDGIPKRVWMDKDFEKKEEAPY